MNENQSNNYSNPLPEAEMHRAHPLAHVAFSFLRRTNKESRLRVLEAIMFAHRKAPQDQRDAFCLYCLDRCKQDIGEIPSASKYVKWLDQQPDKAHLAKKSYVEATYGRWNMVKGRLGSPEIPNYAWTGWGISGYSVSRETVLGALGQWLEQLGVVHQQRSGIAFVYPDYDAYKSTSALNCPVSSAFTYWCKTNSSVATRLPQSLSSVYQYFDSWEDAIRAANEGGSHSDVELIHFR